MGRARRARRRRHPSLAESLVVHETYFFRELDALSVVISEFVVPAIHAGKQPRIWSAACATGA